MKFLHCIFVFYFCFILVLAADAAKVEPLSYYGNIAQRLGYTLPKYHVLQQRLDDSISQRTWTNLVTFYDYDHSVFLKGDLDRLAAREKQLDNEILNGDVSFGYDVYNLFVELLQTSYLYSKID